MTAVHLAQDPALVSRYVDVVARIERSGYDGLWIGEVAASDAVSAAAIAAVGTTQADIGVLLNTFTRAPTTLAMTAWTLAHLAPDRVKIVLGSASPLLVEQWNGIPHRRLLPRLRDTMRFLRAALDGERVEGTFETFASSGFALPRRSVAAPELLIAAVGPGALELAAAEADGVVLNWITPADIERLVPDLPRDRVSLVAQVVATSDRALMERTIRPTIANYLRVPGYADQQRRLGRGPAFEAMWERGASGDRAGAREAIPSSVIDELIVWGEPDDCRRQLDEIEREMGVRVISTVYDIPGRSFEDLAALSGANA